MDALLWAIVALFWTWEVIAHFVAKNIYAHTLSNRIWAFEKRFGLPARLLVGASVIALGLHLVFHLF